MTKIERFIISQIKNERYVLTVHARRRMSERHITDYDLIEMAKNLRSIERQDENDTYLLSGKDTWGEKLFASVAVRDNVIIVTVFFEEDL